MSQVERQELEKFRSFYRRYCDDDIARLAQRYPNKQRSLHVSHDDLCTFDPDLAERYLDNPEDMQEIAEEALRTYDLPADVNLGHAHVRLRSLPELSAIDIRNIGAASGHIGSLVAVQGIVHSATDVKTKIVEAAFRCQRCGTMTYIPQSDSDLQEPHECQGCERQGPFEVNHDQSEFIAGQSLTVQSRPDELPSGESHSQITVELEDDIAGDVPAGCFVWVTGVPHLRGDGGKDFEPVLEAVAIDAVAGDKDYTQPFVEPVPSSLEEYIDAASVALSGHDGVWMEEETKAKLVTPFIESLGWNKYDNGEFRMEYTDPQTSKRADYALFAGGSESPDIIVEAKSVGSNLQGYEDQLCDYLRIHDATSGVLTNGEEFWVYENHPEETTPTRQAQLGLGDLSDADVLGPLNRGESD